MFTELLKKRFAKFGNLATIQSAGTLESAKGQPAAPDWITLEAETSVNLRSHRSTWLGDVDVASFDTILCMDAKTLEEVTKVAAPHTDVELVNAPDGIPNPWEKGLDAYRECYRVICMAVDQVPPHL